MADDPASHRPNFTAANNAYLKIADPAMFKRKVGGHVDDTRGATQWLTDTCTLRLSRALTYSDCPIPNNAPGLRTVHGGDKLNYAYAVQEFHRWIIGRFGRPDIEVKGAPVARDKFASHKGLIIFDIKFGNNPGMSWGAQGHADLWDGNMFYDELWGITNSGRDFFQIVSAVPLWFLAGPGTVGA